MPRGSSNFKRNSEIWNSTYVWCTMPKELQFVSFPRTIVQLVESTHCGVDEIYIATLIIRSTFWSPGPQICADPSGQARFS